MGVCALGGPRVTRVYSQGQGKRDNRGTVGQGAP